MKEISIGDITIGGGSRGFVLIAGPCVIEDEREVFYTLEELKGITSEMGIPFIFKASYDKANRSSIHSFRGPGLEKGLNILRRAGEGFSVPVLTDVHCREDVGRVAEVVDVVQVPAFLCRQTDLLVECGRMARCVNVKKGQFMAPWDMKNVIEKLRSTGNENILLTERGVSFGYNNLVVDFRALPIMRGMGYPVIFDATHSVQFPGGLGDASGGDRTMVRYLARGAVAVGVDGLFMEVHRDPDRALCDGPNSLRLSELKGLLEELVEIDRVVKGKTLFSKEH